LIVLWIKISQKVVKKRMKTCSKMGHRLTKLLGQLTRTLF
jgi:hypothetical protein